MFGKPEQVRKGKLLLANPMMQDANFKRTVVLLVDHNADGTVGFILNKPLDLNLQEAADAFADADYPLHYGGPVQMDTLHFVHTAGALIEGAVHIGSHLFWGGQIESLQHCLEQKLLWRHQIRFFLGYSGWGVQQLTQELELKSWIIADAMPEDVFGDADERLWRTVLRGMGNDYAILANFPEDPRLN